MAGGGRKRKTLGRGMGDLIGNDLESLVRSPSESGTAKDEAAPAPPPTEAPRPQVAPAPPTGRSHPRIFAVASGKGGTGKSLIAINLAVALAERRKVCLIDADFGLGNAHILLGLFPRYNVSHLIHGEQSLDDVLHEGPRGLLLMPGACGVPEMASLDDSTLESFASTVAPVLDRCDVAILDCPAGLTRQSLLLIHGADVVMVVTTDDLTSMTDAYALIKTLVTHRPEMTVGLLVNDARSPAEGAETYRKICHVSRKFLGRELLSLGTIPSDSQLERSVMERRPVVIAHPRAGAARAIEDLAVRLVGLQGLEADLGLPERMHRTLAATGAVPGNGRHGEGLCMS